MEVDNISDVTQAWRMGQMTNFEYLTQLNKLAGRSFNDLMQYPVFPFVLSDYTSQVLDLEDPASYRYWLDKYRVERRYNERRGVHNTLLGVAVVRYQTIPNRQRFGGQTKTAPSFVCYAHV